MATVRPRSSIRSSRGGFPCSCACRKCSTCCASTSSVCCRSPRKPDGLAGKHFLWRWWRYRARPSSVRLEVLVHRLRRGAARAGARGVLAQARLPRRAGLRPDRNRADRDAQPSVQRVARIGGQTDRRRRSPNRGGRRDSRARRQRDVRATTAPPGCGGNRAARSPRPSRTAGSTPATSASSTRTAGSLIKGRKKEMIVDAAGAQGLSRGRRARAPRAAGRQGRGRRRTGRRRRRTDPRGARRRSRRGGRRDRPRRQRDARGSPARVEHVAVAGHGAAPHRRHAEAQAAGAAAVGGGRGARARPPRSAAARRSKTSSRDSSPDAQLTPETTLDELGLSSLDRVEMLMALEEAFQVTLDESALADAKTIGGSDGARSARVRCPGARSRGSRCEVRSQKSEVAARADRVSVLESLTLRVVPASHQPAHVDPAARAGVHEARRPRARTSARTSTARSSSRPTTRATWTRRRSSSRCRRAGATRGAGDGQGVLPRALLSEGVLADGVVHQQPQLLPVVHVLQRLPAAAARSRHAADAALHRRDHRGRLLDADLPGGQAAPDRGHGTLPPGRRR